MKDTYKKQVTLLIDILLEIAKEDVFDTIIIDRQRQKVFTFVCFGKS